MNEKELLKALEEDTRRECADIIENAQKEADGIIKKTEEELEKAKKERLLQAEAYLQRERIKILADARLHANEVILKQKQLAVTKVFEEAGRRLKELRSEKDYPDILKRLFIEASDQWLAKMAAAGDSKAKVMVSRQDTPRLKNAADKNIYDIVPDETEDMSPGIIIVSEDKRFKVNNTLQSRLEKARHELVPMIDKILFA